MTGNPRLIVLSEQYRGMVFELTKSLHHLGRVQGQDIFFDDPTISIYHCSFIRAGDTYVLEDHDSTNGTMVNNVPIKQQELHDGDLLQIGSIDVLFDCDDKPVTNVLRTETGWVVLYSKEISAYEKAAPAVDANSRTRRKMRTLQKPVMPQPVPEEEIAYEEEEYEEELPPPVRAPRGVKRARPVAQPPVYEEPEYLEEEEIYEEEPVVSPVRKRPGARAAAAPAPRRPLPSRPVRPVRGSGVQVPAPPPPIQVQVKRPAPPKPHLTVKLQPRRFH